MTTTPPDQLLTNEQYFRVLFESPSAMISLIDLQGRFLKANQATQDRSGYSMAELERMTIADLTHPEDQHVSPDYFAKILAGDLQSWRGEKRYLMKNGDICNLDLSVNPLRDQAGAIYGFIAMGVETTENKNAVIALAESERRLRTLMSNLPGMAFRYRHCPGKTLEFASEGCLPLTGYGPVELCGRDAIPFLQIIHPLDQQRVREIVQTAVDTVGSYDMEYRIKTKGGELRWVWEKGRVVARSPEHPAIIEGFSTDITPQKQQEEKLKRLQAAIEHASETIVITDHEGVIQYVNPAFEQLTGYSREEAIGKRPSILKSGHQDEAFYKAMWTALLQGEIWKGYLVNKNKQGDLFEEEATITPVLDREGNICHFVAVKRNASREVALKNQLQQAQRMEAIGTLAGGIAHDFNNILTSILGYAEIARDHFPASSPASQCIDQIIQAGDRAASLVKQILTFSRQEKEELRPVHLHQPIVEALSLLRSTLPATIQLDQHLAADCAPVLADASQIQQVLVNLCVNARHAIGNHQGRITVTMAEQTLAAPLMATSGASLPPGTYMVITVGDDGCGMAPEIQAKIFDPFFTTKPTSEGTGLGLSVVHGIVKTHNGAITLASKPGEGTVFHLYLPVCRLLHPEDPLKIDVAVQGNETILLVDDEPILVQMLHNGLARLGYNVLSFAKSTEALAYFTDHADTIDLVVTDMSMPLMAGDVFSQRLLLLKPDLPIILCTGFSEAIDETRARLIGIREFIMKPVVPRNLAQTIRTLFKDGKHPHRR